MKGLLGRLLGRNPARDEALEILAAVVRKAAHAAATAEEIRERLAEAAQRGDLDDVVAKLVGAQRAAELYVKTGKVP